MDQNGMVRYLRCNVVDAQHWLDHLDRQLDGTGALEQRLQYFLCRTIVFDGSTHEC